MISNERQYRITKARLQEFQDAAQTLSEKVIGLDEAEKGLAHLEVRALQSQIAALQKEILDYERLQGLTKLAFEDLSDLPRVLIQARTARGMSQRELAEKLGLREQQIQRYEAGGYSGASLRRLAEVADALNVVLEGRVSILRAMETTDSLKDLEALGFGQDFVRQRLMPFSTEGPSENEFALGEVLRRVYGTRVPSKSGEDGFAQYLEAAGFKTRKGSLARDFGAYAIYTRFLSRLIVKATPELGPLPVPADPGELLKLIRAPEPPSFEDGLKLAWGLGVAVLPLSDLGRFHGACWRIDGRHVVVLKQMTPSPDRWLFDLLHELYHASAHPEESDFGTVETDDILRGDNSSAEEQRANAYAGYVALGGRAEELAARCVKEAGGAVPRLKATVLAVARDTGVSVGGLSNYMAFRLSLQGINWWGAATNLQPQGGEPWVLARNFLLERLTLDALDTLEQGLVAKALMR